MDIILWNDDQVRVVAFTPPGGLTAEEARTDEGLVPQDRPTFIVDNGSLPEAPRAAWRLSAEGVVTTVELPAPVPPIVTAGSFIRAALELDWLDGIDAAVAVAGQQNSLIPLLWQRASQFERAHAFIGLVAAIMGKTDEEVDDLFRLAGTYDAT